MLVISLDEGAVVYSFKHLILQGRQERSTRSNIEGGGCYNVPSTAGNAIRENAKVTECSGAVTVKLINVAAQIRQPDANQVCLVHIRTALVKFRPVLKYIQLGG